jgi:hypothetical protein
MVDKTVGARLKIESEEFWRELNRLDGIITTADARIQTVLQRGEEGVTVTKAAVETTATDSVDKLKTSVDAATTTAEQEVARVVTDVEREVDASLHKLAAISEAKYGVHIDLEALRAKGNTLFADLLEQKAKIELENKLMRLDLNRTRDEARITRLEGMRTAQQVNSILRNSMQMVMGFLDLAGVVPGIGPDIVVAGILPGGAASIPPLGHLVRSVEPGLLGQDHRHQGRHRTLCPLGVVAPLA